MLKFQQKSFNTEMLKCQHSPCIGLLFIDCGIPRPWLLGRPGYQSLRIRKQEGERTFVRHLRIPGEKENGLVTGTGKIGSIHNWYNKIDLDNNRCRSPFVYGTDKRSSRLRRITFPASESNIPNPEEEDFQLRGTIPGAVFQYFKYYDLLIGQVSRIFAPQ